MLLRYCLLLLVAGLGACAHSPSLPPALDACAPAPPGTSLLTLEEADGGTRQLVLHVSREPQGLTFVALDTIGAPQFTARLEGDRLVVESRAVYRGPSPEWLLWGWQWWQARDELDVVCVREAGYRLETGSDSRRLLRRGRVQWQWRAAKPEQYLLPRKGLEVKVRNLESSKQ